MLQGPNRLMGSGIITPVQQTHHFIVTKGYFCLITGRQQSMSIIERELVTSAGIQKK